MVTNKFKNNSLTRKYHKLINEINELENNLRILTNQELRLENLKLQQKYQKTKNLNSLISFSFALTREASQRSLGLRHFDVQLMGGLILNNNRIAEMKTGEGKTLVATLPASLNALTKKGVHIVTVNDYLANRDQVSMGQIYRRLGFNTGLIQQGLNQKKRQINYQSDITYVTNSELAFDFLKDNLTLSDSNIVLKPFNYCIIDEVDSVLIDEAQTPLIISNQKKDNDVEKYLIAYEAIKYLEIEKDFKVNEKDKNVILTASGISKMEQLIQVKSLYNFQNPWIPYVMNALKAQTLFFKNVHYIIQNKRIVIVDEFTGRIMPDRQWGEGLHQAIEAKEELPIRSRTETRASITYQNFFLMYPKFAGMTGTGKTAEIEFEKIYNLSVDVVPTARPSKRNDLLDSIYVDQFSKWNAIAQFCKKVSSKIGQPILIGTRTVEKSEMLAQLLNEYQLPYQLLNAKPENIRRESQIIAQAGKQNSITIATNMAGRGTDIILGGNIEFQAQRDIFDLLVLLKTSTSKNLINSHNLDFRYTRCKILKRLRKFKKFRNTLGCSQKLYSILLTIIKDKDFLNTSEIDILKMLQENDQILIPKTLCQNAFRFLLKEIKITLKKHHKQETKIVKNLGGLYVIGTERNESRRIDNQLRGRCGRQGDPGISHFFLSLDDDLLRLFGGLKVQNFVQRQISEDSPIESNLISNSLDSAQQRMEERAYEQRKNLFDYDAVLNDQRNFIYYHRRLILTTLKNESHNLAYGEMFVCQLFKIIQKKNLHPYNILEQLGHLIGRKVEFQTSVDIKVNWPNYQLKEWKEYFYQEFWLNYLSIMEAQFIYGREIFSNFEKQMGLSLLDIMWQDHIEKLRLLRDAVNWRVYDQSLPLVEYKREAYQIFINRCDEIIFNIQYRTLRSFLI